MSGGKKDDQGKADLSLIPLVAMTEEAKGFMLGEKKYGRYNFTKGLQASRLIAAAMRHILQWQQGEDLDPESGASHLGHARCCLAMLLECQRLGTLVDDRNLPKPEPTVSTADEIKRLAEEGHTLGDTTDLHLKRYEEIAGASDVISTRLTGYISPVPSTSPVKVASSTAAHHTTTRLADGSEVTWWTPPSDLLDYLK